ncbi:MAG: MarR family winged helix-turn-helix transcriptional regulator [Lautropia sp.]
MKQPEAAGYDHEDGLDVMLVLSRVYHRGALSLQHHVGIPNPRWRLMFLLNRHGPSTQKELTAMLNIDPASITRPLNTLQKLGLVARERDAADNRLSRVRLTGAGKIAVRAGMERREAFIGTLLRGLSAGEIRAVVRGLRHMERNLIDGPAAAPAPASRRGTRRAPDQVSSPGTAS